MSNEDTRKLKQEAHPKKESGDNIASIAGSWLKLDYSDKTEMLIAAVCNLILGKPEDFNTIMDNIDSLCGSVLSQQEKKDS